MITSMIWILRSQMLNLSFYFLIEIIIYILNYSLIMSDKDTHM